MLSHSHPPREEGRSKSIAARLFSIDNRSLAIFRIAIGALLLVDLGMRASDLKVMYTDDGMFPRGLIRHHYTSLWYWSFHFGSGSWGFQAVLFGIAALFALALVMGFKTRWAVIGSWLLLVSVQHRVPPILSGADILFRMLLFWAMFLPLERAWSVDRCLAARRRGVVISGDNGRVLSVASAAILLQIGLVYLFSAIFKSNMVWVSGEAIAGILAHDFYASRLGGSLLQFPRVLSGITLGTFFLEWLSPLLLFFPKYTAWIRLGVIAALAAMHAGIAVCLMVDLFSLVALAGLTLFLPVEFWNSHLLARFSRASERCAPRPGAEKYFAHTRASLASAVQDICMLLLIYVIALNIDTLPGRPLAWLALEKWKPLSMGCALGQRWGMFESIPSKDGWYVSRAKLKDGSEVDLLRHGASVNWSRPEFPAGMYPNHRWRKLFREMAYHDEQGYQVFRLPVAKFLCREWNARKTADQQIVKFEFIYCMERKAVAMNTSTPQIFGERLVQLDVDGS